MIEGWKIKRFIDYPQGDYPTQYNAGEVCIKNDEYMIGYEQQGAKDTFSVGQQVFDKDGNLMGYLGIGLYANLDYAIDTEKMPNIRVPVEYWKICLPTVHCQAGKQVFTYWQNKADLRGDTE